MLHEKTTQTLTLDPGSIERLFHDCRSFSSFWRPASHSDVSTFWQEITTLKQTYVNNHFIINVFKYLSLLRLNVPTSSKFLHLFLQNSARRQNSSGNTKERPLFCIYIQYLIAAPDISPVGRWRALDGDRQQVVPIIKHEVHTNKTNAANWNDSKRRKQRIIKQSVLLPEMNQNKQWK